MNFRIPIKLKYLVWAAIILMGLLITIAYFNRSSIPIEILPNRFEELVENGDIKKIIIFKNQEVVDIYLTKEALQKAKYSLEFQNNRPTFKDGEPHYRMEILDAGSFMHQLKELEKTTNHSIPYEIKERQDIVAFLVNWGFLFLIIFGIPVLFILFIYSLLKHLITKRAVIAEKSPDQSHNRSFEKFPVKIGNKVILIDEKQICYFKAADNFVYLHDQEGNQYLMDINLGDLLQKLPDSFIRIHRSLLVNSDKIIEIQKYLNGRYAVILDDSLKSKLVSSRSNSDKIKNLYKI